MFAMQRVIYKYVIRAHNDASADLEVCEVTLIEPKVLSAGLDANGHLCVWISTAPLTTLQGRQAATKVDLFHFGTGEKHLSFPNDVFVGTVLQGQYVWHVFARLSPA